MREEMLNQNKLYQILNTRCNRFEQNYKDALKDNDRLTKQLELVAKTIVRIITFDMRARHGMFHEENSVLGREKSNRFPFFHEGHT